MAVLISPADKALQTPFQTHLLKQNISLLVCQQRKYQPKLQKNIQYASITYHSRYNHVNLKYFFKNDRGNKSKGSKYRHH